MTSQHARALPPLRPGVGACHVPVEMAAGRRTGYRLLTLVDSVSGRRQYVCLAGAKVMAGFGRNERRGAAPATGLLSGSPGLGPGGQVQGW
jgi:hypothetical protein